MKPYLKIMIMTVLLIIFGLFSIIGESEGFRDIPDNNLSYPVLIIMSNNSSGSGFYYKRDGYLYFVTARHVLFNNTRISLKKFYPSLDVPYHLKDRIYYDDTKRELILIGVMTQKDKKDLIESIPDGNLLKSAIEELYRKSQNLSLKNPNAKLISYRMEPTVTGFCELELELEKLNRNGQIVYSPFSDAAVIKIGKFEKSKGELFYEWIDGVKMKQQYGTGPVSIEKGHVKKFKDVLEGNIVYMFGYPTSISRNPQLSIMKPLLRKGIVAGKNEVLKTIILDCPAFYGNSGGLVLEKERKRDGMTYFFAIGVVSQLIPFLGKWVENSGYSVAVPMDVVDELITN